MEVVTVVVDKPRPVHVRVDGWCPKCEGRGRTAFEHVDAGPTQGEVTVAVEVATRIVAEATNRLAELTSHGCEAAAERARMEGRIAAAGAVLDALGVDRMTVEVPRSAPFVVDTPAAGGVL